MCRGGSTVPKRRSRPCLQPVAGRLSRPSALAWPTREIANNAGIDGALIANTLLESNDTNIGYDAQKGEYVDMLQAGIIDPTKRLALQNAASVASLLITTEVLLVEEPDRPNAALHGAESMMV
jgi:chaperonin GroEL